MSPPCTSPLINFLLSGDTATEVTDAAWPLLVSLYNLPSSKLKILISPLSSLTVTDYPSFLTLNDLSSPSYVA